MPLDLARVLAPRPGAYSDPSTSNVVAPSSSSCTISASRRSSRMTWSSTTSRARYNGDAVGGCDDQIARTERYPAALDWVAELAAMRLRRRPRRDARMEHRELVRRDPDDVAHRTRDDDAANPGRCGGTTHQLVPMAGGGVPAQGCDHGAAERRHREGPTEHQVVTRDAGRRERRHDQRGPWPRRREADNHANAVAAGGCHVSGGERWRRGSAGHADPVDSLT
jgi:hypothetical protein